jgi:hypothetical protein
MCQDALEMLVLLCMNHKFMQYMRSKYSDRTQQQFQFTLVDMAGDGSGDEQWWIGLTLQ